MRRRETGVTLMELMITMVVVGILAGIAYPSYRDYMRRAHRAEAKIALEAAAASLEKCFTRFMTYSDVANCPISNQLQAGIMTPKNLYRVSSQAIAANTYVIQAVPQGDQASDAQCSTFTVDERGARAVTGTLAATPQQCWNN